MEGGQGKPRERGVREKRRGDAGGDKERSIEKRDEQTYRHEGDRETCEKQKEVEGSCKRREEAGYNYATGHMGRITQTLEEKQQHERDRKKVRSREEKACPKRMQTEHVIPRQGHHRKRARDKLTNKQRN
ncbi:hypothetical protein Pmani_020756 [Petrolisthes manimaculis]|uniref:Uncharacterized protein n=1 Tax=Petrolisthes manimaculis TaxID=1843537 RepID=A0AAE1PH06_9EUCA|nr:hypothetical protein Pmani_020756 [Petrolisthes manimaculis]